MPDVTSELAGLNGRIAVVSDWPALTAGMGGKLTLWTLVPNKGHRCSPTTLELTEDTIDLLVFGDCTRAHMQLAVRAVA